MMKQFYLFKLPAEAFNPKRILFLTLAAFLFFCSNAQTTSWKGTVSTSWKNSGNWTNGVPTSSKDAILGDANFTGSFQPRVSASAQCKNLTIGGGTKATTLTVSRSLLVAGNLTINSNGTISQGKTNLTIAGNFTNSGTYGFTNNNAKVTFSGSSQTLTGTTTFRKVIINTTSTLTLGSPITVNSTFTLNGVLDPGTNLVTCSNLTVGSTATLRVNTTAFSSNYSTNPTLTAGCIVSYIGTVNQTINSSLTYSTLAISGTGFTKSLTANLSSNLISSDSTKGRIIVASGTLDIGNFTANRGTTVAGGLFQVSNGATLRIGGTNVFPTGFAVISLAANSTVEYYGGAQTVANYAYGNLTLSSTTTNINKTMPTSAMTIYGNFTCTTSSTGLTFSSQNAITVLGNISIGANCTFTGSAHTHTVSGNWTNNGTYSGNATAGTILLNGSSKVISGSGTNNFNNLTIGGTDIVTSGTVNISCAGNMATQTGGTYTQSAGGFTMSGTSRTITGSGISFNDLTLSGSISTSSSFTIAGNLSVSGSLSATAGTITFSGTSKSISGSGSKSFSNVTVTGTLTTAVSSTVTSALSVQSGASLTATAGTVSFTGTSSLFGTANLYKVLVNATSFTLSSNATLGVADTLTLTAGFTTTTSVPNTVSFNGSGAQIIPAGTYYNVNTATGGTKTVTGTINVNGNMTIATSTTLATGSNTINVGGNWANSGTLTAGTSTVTFNGNSSALISGTNTFSTLVVNKNSSSLFVLLAANTSTTNATITAGFLRTATFTLTITGNRSGNGYIFGNIRRQLTFATGTAYAFEGPDNTITFSSVSSVTEITVSVFDATAVSDYPSGSSINRYYNISIPSGTYNATLRLHYTDAELNGNNESTMDMRSFTSGSWTLRTKTANSTTNNYLEKSGLTSIATRWTIADGDNIVAWRGYTSGDWSTTSNWRAISGSPSIPPSASDVVLIGDSTIVTQPTITTSANAKVLVFDSVATATITLSTGGTLNVAGNISGSWNSTNRTHTIDVGSRTLTAGNIIQSDGTSGHNINITTNGGTINVTNDLNLLGSASLTLSGNAALNIGGNFAYTAGTFTAGSGSTVTYNGTALQKVAGLTYHHLTVNKSSGIAQGMDDITLNGNLTLTAGTLSLDSTISVTGNMSIASTCSLYFNRQVTLSGNLANSGSMFPTGSNFIFSGTASQSISGGSFHDLTINKSSGTATLTSNATLAHDLSIQSGTFDLSTFTANRSIAGATFVMSSAGNLIIGGANNFPSNFSSYTLNAASTTTYNGTVAQTVNGITYGNLVFSNGGTNAKTLNGNAEAAGDLTISNGATFSTSTFLLAVAGNWTNNGTFTPSTGTVDLEGSSKTLNGVTTFYKLSVPGSYTVNNVNLTFNGAVEVTGTFTTGTGTMTVNGDLINRGTISNDGVVTFTGTVAQTIRLINALISSSGTVNFNGSVAPVLSSNTSPQYLNLNINNTAGVSPSVAWAIGGNFTVASGASFLGGPFTHTFLGNFTNNGTVTSRGNLLFNPSTSVAVNVGSSFTSTGTVTFSGSGAITISGTPTTLTNIIVSNTHSSGITPNMGWTIAGNFTIASGSTFNASTFTYNIDSTFTCNGAFNAGTSTFNFRGTAGYINGDNEDVFYNVQINSGAIVEALNDVCVSHNFVKNGTYVLTDNLLIFTGSGNSTLSASSYPFSLANLSVEKDTITDTLKINGRLDLVQYIEVVSGVMDADTVSLFEDAVNTGEFVVDSLAVFITRKTSSPVFPTYTTTTLENYSTVEYGSRTGGTQAINATLTYGHIKLSGKGSKTTSAALTINNNFTLSGGTFVGGSFTHNIGGNWTMTADTFTNTGTTINLNGTIAQTISSTGAFNNLIVNNTSGGVTCSTNVTVAGTLTLTSGIVKTNSQVMIVTNTSTNAIARTNGWINGNLRRSLPASGTNVTYNYQIGDSANYTPVAVTFASLTGAGTLTASATAGDHPNLSSSTLSPSKSVNRYYTLTNSATTFSTYSAAFTFVAGDLDAGVNTASLIAGRYNGSTWTSITPSATSSTSFTVASQTAFGAYTAGEGASKTWDGGASTLNWNDANNWNPNGVPTSTDNITITTNTGTVIVNTAAVGKDLNLNNSSGFGLQISSGNSLTISDVLTLSTAGIDINGQTLTLNGTFSSSGTGTITGSNTSTLVIGGTGAFGAIRMNQTSSGSTNRLNNFTFNRTSTGTLSLANSMQVIGVVTATNGTLSSGGNLVLKAVSNTSYGQLAGTGSGTITGDVVVEKAFANTNLGWRHICLPAQTTIDSISGMQVQMSSNPIVAQRSIFWWDPSATSGVTANGWSYADSTKNQTHAYAVYSNNTHTGLHELASTISVTGELVQSSYTINLLNTRDPLGSGTSNEYGWNFIPNRFASNLDVSDLIGDANFTTGYKAIHVWDMSANQYIGINSSGLINYNTGGSISSTNNISPWQAFWVKADSSGQSIQIKNAHRTTSMTNVVSFMKNLDFMRLNVTDKDGRMDQVAVQFAADATYGMDGDKDIYKFRSTVTGVPTMYIRESTLNLSASAIPYSDSKTVELVFESSENKSQYTIAPDLDNLVFEGSVMLEDKKTGTLTDMRTGTYTFVHDKNFDAQRFLLHFNKKSSSTKDLLEKDRFYVYGDEEGIHVVYENANGGKPAEVMISNVLGQQLYHNTYTLPGQPVHFTVPDLHTQMYFVTIICDGRTETFRIIY